MKKMNRFFALLLACLFCLGTFLACDSDTPAPGTEGTTALPDSGAVSDTAPVTAPGTDIEPPADEGPVISEAAQGITIATEEMVAQWDAMVEAKRQEILSTPNMDVSGFKKVYYVSPSGDDSNDGLSPETAWKTIDKLNSKYIGKDCCVCFERGGIYRGKIVAAFGVTYTAYGEGPKPEIWGSPFNGAEYGSWEEVAPNIWRYSEKIAYDVGLIVMNGGEEWGFKILLNYSTDPITEFREDGSVPPVWDGYTSLDANYEFFHDLGGATAVNMENPGYVYLYCDKGNPADVWDSIEFSTRGNIIEVNKDNVTIDNLTVKYGGGAGIGGGSFNMKNFTVTNCEIGWIGGSIQTYSFGGRPRTLRFGNGVEIYGGCTNYTVDNCWIYQVYDSAVTFQFGQEEPTSSVTMDNVHFTNNVIEKCATCIEYFLAGADGLYPEGVNRYMKDIYFTGNILLDAGYGFSAEQRQDRTNESLITGFVHWNKREGEFIIENNLLLCSKYMIMNIGADHYEDLPELRNNVIVQIDTHLWGRYEQNVGGFVFTKYRFTYEEISRADYAQNEIYVIPKAN